MARICSAPVPALERHEIADGDRAVTVRLDLDWGAADIRDSHTGDYVFCSFRCAADWFAAKAADHDGHVLVHGEPPEGDEPDGQ